MTITRDIVERHHGQLVIQSPLGAEPSWMCGCP